MELALGIGAIAVASAAYSVGVVLQALDARDEPRRYGLRLSLLGRLARRRRWLFGTALSVAAFPLQILAYQRAPLILVQCGLACGLVLLLILGSRMMDEPVTARDYVAIAAIIVGVGLVAVAGPSQSEPTRTGLDPVIAMGVLAAAAAVPYALGARLPAFAVLVTLSSGLAFAWNDLATKLTADGLTGGDLVTVCIWAAATGISAIVATLSEMTAFQRLPATKVVPSVFVLEAFVPVLMGPVLLREPEHLDGASIAALGVAAGLICAAIVVLARTRTVTAIVSEEALPRDSRESRPERQASDRSGRMLRPV